MALASHPLSSSSLSYPLPLSRPSLVQAIDNDDGSAYYHTHDNVFIAASEVGP
jgi:hypothetical protein